LNRKKRFEIAAVVLADARKENRDGKVVLVEGKRDVRALKNLGFTGEIVQLNRGWPVDKVVVWMFEKYQMPPIVLMDWDRTGGRLQKSIQSKFQSLDVLIPDEPRRTLSKAIRPDTLCVEALNSLADYLLPLMQISDPEGGDLHPSL
jgi:5S rRNA maturation endonuclease (ribonuclease M5)|tara:strand:+ start:121 stop:561 length:441 start_codon:yes stop_codon:yes gene_type:complete